MPRTRCRRCAYRAVIQASRRCEHRSTCSASSRSRRAVGTSASATRASCTSARRSIVAGRSSPAGAPRRAPSPPAAAPWREAEARSIHVEIVAAQHVLLAADVGDERVAIDHVEETAAELPCALQRAGLERGKQRMTQQRVEEGGGRRDSSRRHRRSAGSSRRHATRSRATTGSCACRRTARRADARTAVPRDRGRPASAPGSFRAGRGCARSADRSASPRVGSRCPRGSWSRTSPRSSMSCRGPREERGALAQERVRDGTPRGERGELASSPTMSSSSANGSDVCCAACDTPRASACQFGPVPRDQLVEGRRGVAHARQGQGTGRHLERIPRAGENDAVRLSAHAQRRTQAASARPRDDEAMQRVRHLGADHGAQELGHEIVSVAGTSARFIASASAMSVAAALGRRRTNSRSRPRRSARRAPSAVPSRPGPGATSGGASSMANSCCVVGAAAASRWGVGVVGGRSGAQDRAAVAVAMLREERFSAAGPCSGGVALRMPIAMTRAKPGRRGAGRARCAAPCRRARPRRNRRASAARRARPAGRSSRRARTTSRIASRGRGRDRREWLRRCRAQPRAASGWRRRPRRQSTTKRSGRRSARASGGTSGATGSPNTSVSGSASASAGAVARTTKPARHGPALAASRAHAPSYSPRRAASSERRFERDPRAPVRAPVLDFRLP